MLRKPHSEPILILSNSPEFFTTAAAIRSSYSSHEALLNKVEDFALNSLWARVAGTRPVSLILRDSEALTARKALRSLLHIEPANPDQSFRKAQAAALLGESLRDEIIAPLALEAPRAAVIGEIAPKPAQNLPDADMTGRLVYLFTAS